MVQIRLHDQLYFCDHESCWANPALRFPKFQRYHLASHRRCDKDRFDVMSPAWRIFHGCGQSFHIVWILPANSESPNCWEFLFAEMEAMTKKANSSIFNVVSNSNKRSTARKHYQMNVISRRYLTIRGRWCLWTECWDDAVLICKIVYNYSFCRIGKYQA